MNMRKKEELGDTDAELPEPIRKWKEERIRDIRAVLRSPVESLKLSEECLFQLWKFDFASPEYAEQQFNCRLKEYKPSGALTEYKEILKSVQYDSSKIHFYSSSPMFEYEKILDTAVEMCLAPLKSLDRPFGESEATYSVSKQFQRLTGEIISKTHPKEIVHTDLSEKQIEFLSTDGCGIETIEDVFYMMESKYLTACYEQHRRKYSLMSKWLEKNHPHLYEFYLNGKTRYGERGSVFPPMRKRLRNLDKLVNSKEAKPETVEIAFRQLKCLIEDDLLFASVFYSYFYEQQKGRLPDLKRRALKEAKPYVYYLKLFNIQPIDYNGVEIKSIYDLGVLLLNALAGGVIYSTDKLDPIGNGQSGVNGHYFKFKGTLVLFKELDSFRKQFRELM
jgi:hypothetical protein